jgi:hypothetical protein
MRGSTRCPRILRRGPTGAACPRRRPSTLASRR